MPDADPTDLAGKLVRFAIGAVFGAFLALGVAMLHPMLWKPVPFWTLFASSTIGCGLMASFWGEDFLQSSG